MPGRSCAGDVREPLDVEGERVRRVGSLATDRDGASVALFRLRAEEAGALLDADRDMDAIVRICRRLDGIPLAIELAAARARSLRPAEIAERLDDMFRLLTGRPAASTERHRTLRATLEWSYDLLPAPERAVLDRLSIFAGSFALDAVEAVAVGEPVLPEDVVDIIDRLVSRSLLVPVGDADETRFRLLEPVRHLAAEKLAGRGETDSARHAHTQWYLDLIVRLGERWRAGDDQGTWPIAARELPNLQVAFDHLVETGRGRRPALRRVGLRPDRLPLRLRAGCTTGRHGPASLDPDHVGRGRPRCVRWRRGARSCRTTSSARRRGFVAGSARSRRARPTRGWSRRQRCITSCRVASSRSAMRSWTAAWRPRCRAAISTGRSGSSLRRPSEEALDAAVRLGNKLLIATARFTATVGRRGSDELRELFWEAAQQSHSYLMLNHAAIELGTAQVRARRAAGRAAAAAFPGPRLAVAGRLAGLVRPALDGHRVRCPGRSRDRCSPCRCDRRSSPPPS